MAIPRNKQTKNKKTKDKATMTEERKKEFAAESKAKGNQAFGEEDYEEAVYHFGKAIEYDPTDHVFYSNRSAANLKQNKISFAIKDAEECITLKPDWPKGYSRLGGALAADKSLQQALEAYNKGLELSPDDKALLSGKAAVQQILTSMDVAQAEDGPEDCLDRDQVGAGHCNAATVIGIDLGTTYSCVGVWVNNRVEILQNELGQRTTPSWVSFTPEGERLVGDAAKAQAAANPKNTVYDVKRLIGQNFSSQAVQAEMKHMMYDVVEGPDDKPMIEVEMGGAKKRFTPEQISSMVLLKMKGIAETFLGHSVEKAVITVPAYFNDAQRNATKNAGTIAGLEVLRIINEPTAAALSYGLDEASRMEGTKNVLVFDLGGGTFDASLLEIDNGVFEVKATGGDTRLGGEDFDQALLDWASKECEKQHKVDPRKTARSARRLQTACERAKRMLSSATSTVIEVDSLIEGCDFSVTLSRSKFESLNTAFFTKIQTTVKNVLADAKVSAEGLAEIVLVGGSSRIPKVQTNLSEMLGGKELCKSVNPDEAVAYGAGVQGAILGGMRHSSTQSLLLVDVIPLSLGIETQGKQMATIIKRNTSVPCSKRDTFTTTENFQDCIDVDVYEGERACTDGNHKLGHFQITGIQRAKRGEPKIEVRFDIDANGILKVSAEDQVTGAKAKCEIDNASKGLSQEQIDEMVAEAAKFAADDERLRQKMEKRNALEQMIYSAVDQGEAENNTKVVEKAREVQAWLDENFMEGTTAQFEKKIEQLERVFSG